MKPEGMSDRAWHRYHELLVKYSMKYQDRFEAKEVKKGA